METQLAFDSRAKQLNLAFKERFVTDSNFQLKITGNVNTQTGNTPNLYFHCFRSDCEFA